MNLLIVDDHELFRDGIQLVLRKIDDIASIQAVSTGREALSLVSAGGDFDAVLLDYNLEDTNGIDVLLNIKNQAPEIPVIMLSAVEDAGLIQQAIQSGANGFITKTSRSEVMISAVKLVLSGGMYIPPEALAGALTGQNNTPPQSATPATHFIPQPSGVYKITERQHEVLSHMAAGLSNKEIAKVLNMSPSTVKVHVAAILREFEVGNRIQAISKAKEHGFIA